MLNDATSSADASAKTWEREPKHAATEADFLAEQLDQSRAAIARTLQELKGNAAAAADLRFWTDRHPWLTVAAATVTGFAAAAVILPAKGEKLTEKWSRTAGMLFGDDDEEDELPEEPAPRVRKRKAAKSSFLTPLLAPLVEALFIAAQNFVMNMMARPTPEPSPGMHPDEMHPEAVPDAAANGHPESVKN
jgi:hypothetical protein